MKKQEKVDLVKNLTEELKTATSVVLVDSNKLTVKSQQALKVRLEEAGARMQVVKNTLLKRAGTEAKLASETYDDSVLTGPTAIVIGTGDPIAPLQALYKFSKEFEVPNLKVGIVEGNFQDKVALEKLAQLPSKNILFAQVVGMIASPMSSMVYTMQANIQKLLYVLKAKAEQN
jgi:large subunit ribosomal protein L10